MTETKPCIRCREDRQFALSLGYGMPTCELCGGTGRVPIPTTQQPRHVDDALLTYRAIFNNRTRYEGQQPRDDELLVAEIDRLRNEIDALLQEKAP